MYSFDLFGFLSESTIAGRETSVAPPDAIDWPASHRPNWTGTTWIYLAWPLPPDPPPVPDPVTARQIRIALNQIGLRDAVEAAVSAGGRELQDWWEYSTEVHRDNPLVLQMIAALSVSDAQADALWALGATL